MKQISEQNNLKYFTASTNETLDTLFNEPTILIVHSSELINTLLEKFSSQIKLIVDIGGNLNKILSKIKPYKHCIIEASEISEAVNIVKQFKSSAKKVIYFQPENEMQYKTEIEKS